MKSPLLILSATDVQHLVQTVLDPNEAVKCMARTFEISSESRKKVLETSEHDRVQQVTGSTLSPSHITWYMPCRVPVPAVPKSPIFTAIKVVSLSRQGGEGGVPATTLVLNEQTGAAQAVVNSRELTAVRNAASSVLATQLLGTPTPTHITFFGAGLQIKYHALLLIQAYPSIMSCTIINRSCSDRYNQLILYLTSKFPNVQIQGYVSTSTPSSKIEAAVRSADVICTATPSTAPLFDSSWVKQGAHINLVGSYTPSMHEVDSNLIVKRAGRCIVVDEAESCLEEAGELIKAGILEDEMIEIGLLVKEGTEGELERRKVKEAGDVTVFKSVGVGVQDVAIAALVVELAERNGSVGIRIPYD